MNVKEIKEKLAQIRDDCRIELDIPINMNGQQGEIRRNVDSLDVDEKSNVVIMKSHWPMRIYL